jgi:hypothetical protein
MTARYYLSRNTGALLRRVDGTDAALVDGQWRPTKQLMEQLLHPANDLTAIPETQARKLERLRKTAARPAGQASGASAAGS